MNGTTVACIIPHYNQLDTLRRAVESALPQCDQVIVLDDATPRRGDTPHGLSNVEDVLWDIYSNQPTLPLKLKILANFTREGVCRTRNLAALLATCDYLLPLDADDWLVSGAVAHFRPLLAGNAFVYGDWLDEPGGVYRQAAPLERLKDKNVAKATFFISRAMFQVIGGYDVAFEDCGAEDWALMRALVKAGGKGLKVSVPLYHYTVHSNGRAALPMQHADTVRSLMQTKFEVTP